MIAAPPEPKASGCSESSSSCSSEAEDEPVERLAASGWLSAELPNGCPLPSPEPPSFAEVNVTHSSNVHLGNRTFYKGPLTIKQFVYSNSAALPPATTPLDTCSGESKPGSTQPLYPLAKPSAWFHSKRYLVGVCAAALIIASATALTVWLASSTGIQYPSKRPIVPAVPNDSSINNEPTIPGVRIVERIEWGAQPPNLPPTPLAVRPPVYVIISHTATGFCYTQAQCVLVVRLAQTFHIESKGWNDIGFSFLVGGDGLVYEGRGWDVEGAHTYNYNNRSIGISFIGTFNQQEPTNAQIHAAKKLIQLGVESGKISGDYKLLGHRQCTKTESPGEALYAIIKTWPHWSPTP